MGPHHGNSFLHFKTCTSFDKWLTLTDPDRFYFVLTQSNMLPELTDSVETGEQSKMKITSSEADITATVSDK